MRFLKRILDLINSLVKAWPYLIIVLGWITSAILWLVRVGQLNVILSIPLSLLIAIAALALYPVAKTIQFAVERMRTPSFEYCGLLWKPSIIGHSRPFCLVQGCGRKVFYKILEPAPVRLMHPNDWSKANWGNTYIYECPLHGRIQSVPNWSMVELKKKANSIQRKK